MPFGDETELRVIGWPSMWRRTFIQMQAAAAAPFPAPEKTDSASFGGALQRSMTLMATSTPHQRNAVKVLFYGQSITKQNWWMDVAGRLRAQYPYADLTIVNRSIGGFAANLLKRTMAADILPFYPDLIIMHDYGGESDYEEIIRWIRSNTTAELALATDHITWMPDEAGANDTEKLKSYNWHERHCAEWMPQMARKYGIEIVDIRTPWKKYLAANHLKPADILSDGVHLNAQGEYLMASLVSEYLRYDPKFPRQAWSGLAVDVKPEWKQGRLALEFQGNRLDLLASRGDRQPWTKGRILIDGRPPSSHEQLYAFTRPSDGAAVDWPFVIHVGHEAPLQVEDWFLTITKTDPANQAVEFEVRGSKTGPDGSGISTERFVSRSKRVVLEPADWHLNRAYELRKTTTPVGAVCHWRVEPLFRDFYEPPRVDDRTREYPVTVARGLSNGTHRLEIISETPEALLLESIRIYRPPLV